MNSLPVFLEYSLSFLSYFKYVLVFLGSVIEGPIVMIASGFLFNLGFFSLAPLFAALLLGDLVGDIIWYYVGYYFAEPFIKRFGKYFSLTPETFEKVKVIFHRHHSKILFFSKLVMGFGMAIYILMVAGATKVSFSKYMILNTIGEIFFVGMLLLIGYYFGGFSRYMSNGLKIGFVVILSFILVLFIYNFQKYIKNKALKNL